MKYFKEWCIENEQNLLLELYENAENKCSSDKIGFSSGKVVNWKCKKCGKEWKRSLNKATRKTKKEKKECPYCTHERTSEFYNLSEKYPQLAKDWNYEKNSKPPTEYTPRSKAKVWWICEYNPNHTWEDTVANRTALNRKCKICSKEFTISFPARVLYYYLKKHFNDCQMESKILGKYVADICIPYHKIIIEYDGWYYHSSKESKSREEKKDNFLKKENYKVIRIKESKEKMDEIICENNTIKYHLKEEYKNLNELIKEVLCIIEELTNVKISTDIDFKRDYQKIEDLYYHVRKSNSLAVKHPNLSKEWSNNNNILPDTINVGSQRRIKWICPKCNREYEATIYNRVRNKSACPYCSNKKVCEENSLAKNFPEIAKEWNYEKNAPLLPENVIKGSGKKVWWKCEYGHEWEAQVCKRTGPRKSKCPICRNRD